MHNPRGKTGASFGLQLILIISIFICPLWILMTLGLLIYKGIVFPYPDHALGLEIASLILSWFVVYYGTDLGKRGNLTENPRDLIAAAVLLFIAAFGSFYYMWLQVYVLRMDVGCSAIMFGFLCLSFLLCVAAIQAAGSSQSVIPPSAPPPIEPAKPRDQTPALSRASTQQSMAPPMQATAPGPGGAPLPPSPQPQVPPPGPGGVAMPPGPPQMQQQMPPAAVAAPPPMGGAPPPQPGMGPPVVQ